MLTDLKARQAKPRARDYKLSDSGGLYLYVTTKGFRSWRMKYRFGGKEKRLVFGSYPEISLTEARDKREAAKRLLREHRDPAIEALKRRLAAAADHEATFESVARRWYAMHESRWAPVHAADVLKSLEREVFPALGPIPIRQLEAPLVLGALRKIEARGSLETAKRVRQRISAVFVHAISEGICASDPAAMVAKAMKPARKRTKQPAIADLAELQELLRTVEASGASPVTKVASRLLALTAVRPAVLRGATWDEFEGIDWTSSEPADAVAPLWRVPSRRMKLVLDRKDDDSYEHLVPLSRQAVEALAAIRPLTGRYRLVFPSARHGHRPMSENAIGYLYNRCGYHGRHVPHGWRAAFSTIMNERAEREGRAGDRAIIDLMLAHIPANKVEGAYNRAAYAERRREIGQDWADLLMEGLAPATQLLESPRR
ncbi:MAG TPA: integrase arm-type DNA-binding domain-containing protein [Allosphingosinicella sp.]|nr:integrase arm-type DNA-binding domain-containing protein [Allosphingosinicella sp.]